MIFKLSYNYTFKVKNIIKKIIKYFQFLRLHLQFNYNNLPNKIIN